MMECRSNCGACCIYPSISSAIPGMPKGKPAGTKCIHLQEDYKCAIYEHPKRPIICHNFKADPLVCGNSQEEAKNIFIELES